MAITFAPPDEAPLAAPATPDATPQPDAQPAQAKNGIRFDPPPDVSTQPTASAQPAASPQPAAKGGIRFDPPPDVAAAVPHETSTPVTPQRFAPANPTPAGARDYGAANRLARPPTVDLVNRVMTSPPVVTGLQRLSNVVNVGTPAGPVMGAMVRDFTANMTQNPFTEEGMRTAAHHQSATGDVLGQLANAAFHGDADALQRINQDYGTIQEHNLRSMGAGGNAVADYFRKYPGGAGLSEFALSMGGPGYALPGLAVKGVRALPTAAKAVGGVFGESGREAGEIGKRAAKWAEGKRAAAAAVPAEKPSLFRYQRAAGPTIVSHPSMSGGGHFEIGKPNAGYQIPERYPKDVEGGSHLLERVPNAKNPLTDIELYRPLRDPGDVPMEQALSEAGLSPEVVAQTMAHPKGQLFQRDILGVARARKLGYDAIVDEPGGQGYGEFIALTPEAVREAHAGRAARPVPPVARAVLGAQRAAQAVGRGVEQARAPIAHAIEKAQERAAPAMRQIRSMTHGPASRMLPGIAPEHEAQARAFAAGWGIHTPRHAAERAEQIKRDVFQGSPGFASEQNAYLLYEAMANEKAVGLWPQHVQARAREVVNDYKQATVAGARDAQGRPIVADPNFLRKNDLPGGFLDIESKKPEMGKDWPQIRSAAESIIHAERKGVDPRTGAPMQYTPWEQQAAAKMLRHRTELDAELRQTHPELLKKSLVGYSARRKIHAFESNKGETPPLHRGATGKAVRTSPYETTANYHTIWEEIASRARKQKTGAAHELGTDPFSGVSPQEAFLDDVALKMRNIFNQRKLGLLRDLRTSRPEQVGAAGQDTALRLAGPFRHQGNLVTDKAGKQLGAGAEEQAKRLWTADYIKRVGGPEAARQANLAGGAPRVMRAQRVASLTDLRRAEKAARDATKLAGSTQADLDAANRLRQKGKTAGPEQNIMGLAKQASDAAASFEYPLQGLERALAENRERLPQVQNEMRAAQEEARLKQSHIDREMELAARGPTQTAINARARELQRADLEEYYRIADTVHPGGTRVDKATGVRSPYQATITPDWKFVNGKWQIAGEFEDAAQANPKWFNRSNRPKGKEQAAGLSGIVPTVEGNLYKVAQTLKMSPQDLLAWMARNPRPPSLTRYIEDATNEAAESSGYNRQHLSELETAHDELTKRATDLEREVHGRRFVEHAFAPDVRKAITATRKAQRRIDAMVNRAVAMEPGSKARQQVAVLLHRRFAATANEAAKNARRLTTDVKAAQLQRIIGTAENAKLKAYRQKLQELLSQAHLSEEGSPVRYGEIVPMDKYGRPLFLPAAKTAMGMKGVDGERLAREVVDYLEVEGAPMAEREAVGQAMGMLANLYQSLLVYNPIIHGVPNMGVNYVLRTKDLAGWGQALPYILGSIGKAPTGRFVSEHLGIEGIGFDQKGWDEYMQREFSGGSETARKGLLGGGAVTPPPPQIPGWGKHGQAPGSPQWAAASQAAGRPDLARWTHGGVVDWNQMALDTEAHAPRASFAIAGPIAVKGEDPFRIKGSERVGPRELATRSYEGLGKTEDERTGNLLRKYAQQMQEHNSNVVFNRMQRWYATSILRHLVEKEGMDPFKAADEARLALDTDRVSALEKRAVNSWGRLAIFYPWMKTIIPFANRMLVQSPELINASTQGARVEREYSGEGGEYEGEPAMPASPLGLVLGHAPSPTTGPLAGQQGKPQVWNAMAGVMAPIEAEAEAVMGSPDPQRNALERARSYAVGHLMPPYRTAINALSQAAGYKVAPYDQVWDPDANILQKAASIPLNVAGQFGFPGQQLQRIEQMGPRGLASTLLGGGSPNMLEGTDIRGYKHSTGPARELDLATQQEYRSKKQAANDMADAKDADDQQKYMEAKRRFEEAAKAIKQTEAQYGKGVPF